MKYLAIFKIQYLHFLLVKLIEAIYDKVQKVWKCPSGFISSRNGCTDVNECIDDVCDINASCTNNDGSFTCECNNGFKGDGFSCNDINECRDSDSCDDNAICTNSDGSYRNEL